MAHEERDVMLGLRNTMNGITQTCNRIAGLVEDTQATATKDLADVHEVLGNLIAAVNNLANIVHEMELNPLKMVEYISTNSEYMEKVKEVTENITGSIASENLATLQAPAEAEKYVFQNCTFNGPVIFEPNDFPPDVCDDEDFWESYDDSEDDEDDDEEVYPEVDEEDDRTTETGQSHVKESKCYVHKNFITRRYRKALSSLIAWEVEGGSERDFPAPELKFILDLVVLNPDYYETCPASAFRANLQKARMKYLYTDDHVAELLAQAEEHPSKYLAELYEFIRAEVNYECPELSVMTNTPDLCIEFTCHLMSDVIRKSKCHLQDEMMRGLEKDGGKE